MLLLRNAPLVLLVAVLSADFIMMETIQILGGRTGTYGVILVLTSSVIIWITQLGVAFATHALRNVARTAARAAMDREQLRTREAVSEELHRDRRVRYASLADAVVPLLQGLATGAYDPADQSVRQACAVQAARIRRLLAESDDVPDRLLHELRAGIEIAERRGVAVSLAVRGNRVALPPAVRRALIEPVLAVLATAATTARATVVGSPTSVKVGVVADSPERSREELLNPEHSDQVNVTLTMQKGRVWVEATWSSTTSSQSQ
ncbi:hypothetical protein [Thermoactinospora rubra]|uniref:hypothetical protein n=1 Tax=Thermoactinospora rubra TaxID=1088767 RepID=UPI00117F37E8|nr:hypothetical protein [Thermoactinospora rubra]